MTQFGQPAEMGMAAPGLLSSYAHISGCSQQSYLSGLVSKADAFMNCNMLLPWPPQAESVVECLAKARFSLWALLGLLAPGQVKAVSSAPAFYELPSTEAPEAPLLASLVAALLEVGGRRSAHGPASSPPAGSGDILLRHTAAIDSSCPAQQGVPCTADTAGCAMYSWRVACSFAGAGRAAATGGRVVQRPSGEACSSHCSFWQVAHEGIQDLLYNVLHTSEPHIARRVRAATAAAAAGQAGL